MSNDPENINVHFFQIVFSLQTAAMQQMGKIVSPVTNEVERDLTIAQTTIDILAMLETKMKGNLTDEEAGFISRALYELRMNFVDESKKADISKDSSAKYESKSEDPEPHWQSHKRAQRERRHCASSPADRSCRGCRSRRDNVGRARRSSAS